MENSFDAENSSNDNPIRLNIQAVQYLSLGMHDEASSVLHNACICLKKQLDLQDSIGFMSKDNSPNVENSVHSISALEGHKLDSSPTSMGGHSALSCFNRAFTVPLYDNSLDEPFAFRDRNRLIAILFYNMGLVQHINGSFDGNSDKFLMALHFYSMSYRIIESAWGIIGIQDIKLLLYALWNNMAHIHFIFHNIEEGRICTYQKLCILRSMAYSDSTEDSHLLEAVYMPMASAEQFLSTAPVA